MPTYDIGEVKGSGEDGEWNGVYKEYSEYGFAAVRTETGSAMMAFARMNGKGALPKELVGMYTELKFANEAIGRYEARLKAEEAAEFTKQNEAPKRKAKIKSIPIQESAESAFQGA